MAGFLSLSDSLTELVGQKVIGTRQEGLKDWCRVTTTCKRLWDMQLPGSALKWFINLSDDIKGASKGGSGVGFSTHLPNHILNAC